MMLYVYTQAKIKTALVWLLHIVFKEKIEGVDALNSHLRTFLLEIYLFLSILKWS